MKTFQMTAKLDLIVSTEVKAESLEEALVIARSFKPGEFVSFKGEWIDGVLEINGIYE